MAQSKNPHQINGKLGDLVFYERFGKSYVRSTPTKKRKSNPTEKTIHSRKRFALSNEAAQGLQQVISQTYQEFKGKTSLYHKALGQINLFAINISEKNEIELNFKTLPVALGTLIPVTEPVIEIVSGYKNKGVKLEWDSSFGEKNDTLSWVVVFQNENPNRIEGQVFHTTVRREESSALFEFPEMEEEDEQLFVYAYFRNDEKQRNSSSIYCANQRNEKK